MAKAAVRDNHETASNNRVPMSTLHRELEEETILKWQKTWEESTNAAQTKQFFPKVSDRLKLKIAVNPNFTAIVTGHGKTRAHLQRFKLLGSATCPCGKDQTTDHLLYTCTLLQHQRETLKKETLKHGNWPISKHDLITEHLKPFVKFAKSRDFEKL